MTLTRLSVLPGGATTLRSLSPRAGGKGGRGGAALRLRNLTLGRHFTAIQCSESAASSHFQQERFPFWRHFNPAAGKACREIRFGWEISFSEAGRREAAAGTACLPVFRNPNSSCAIYQVVELFYCVCGVLVTNKMKCISEKKNLSLL